MTGGKDRGDRLNVLPRFLLIVFLLVVPFAKASPAAAQEGGTLVASTPDLGSFPMIHFRLDALDAQGQFVDSLSTENIQVIEDGEGFKPQSLDKIQTGLQTILVLNTSPAMSNQFNGMSEYDLIQKALSSWAESLPASQKDDFSYSTPTGLSLSREHDPNLLVKALKDYKPDLAKLQPSLGSLAEALDLATDPLGSTATRRAILYITPALPADTNATLADLTNRAKQVGVKVNVWQFLTTAPAADNTAANPLQQLAQITGGQYATLLPNTALPEVEPLFAPLRSTYQVTYRSNIQKSGQHSIRVKIDQSGLPSTSNENSFNLTVEPPNPIFLSPPASIQRTWDTTANKTNPILTPDQIALQIVIEFPDQHHRALKATRLFVNDQMVQENTSEPFDRFNWSIGDLSTTSRQMLRVEAVDELNLSGSSLETPVDILIDQPAKASLADRISGRGMIAIASVVAAGSVLAIVFILTSVQRRARHKPSQAEKKRMKDPVSQPVPIPQDHSKPLKGQVSTALFGAAKSASKTNPSKPASSWPMPSWPRPSSQTAPARLVVLDENEQPITGGAIPLARQEITFGKDPRRATQVLDSPTVDDLHARLYRDPDGNYYLADQESVAGTWVNYAPVTAAGARLENGDLIHIGKIMFRFEITDHARATAAEIKVTDLEM